MLKKIFFKKIALYLSVSVFNWEHYILRLQLETGQPFYMVIRATRSSSLLQCKGSNFISQLF